MSCFCSWPRSFVSRSGRGGCSCCRAGCFLFRCLGEFIQVAGIADFDPKAKTRAGELRDEMKQASQEIAKDPTRMRAADREGIAPQVRNFVRQAERERVREKGKGVEKDEGLER